MRLRTIPLVALLATLPVSAAAQGVWGSATTFVRGFTRPAGGDVAQYLPFYEQVELHARRVVVDGLSLHSSFWGLVDFVDIQDRYRATGDVSTLYVSYLAPTEGRLRFLRGLEVTAGRQFVALGPVVLEQVDGGKLHYLHRSGFEVGIFGGAPTGTRVAFQPWPADEDRYNYGYSWLLGGRVGFVDLGHLATGVSFVHRRYRGRVAESDLGVDLGYSPISYVDLTGSGTVSLEVLRPKELRAGVVLTLIKPLSLNFSYQYASPDLWLPRTSIFAVFSEETFQEAALEARWQATRRLVLDAGYGRRFLTAARDGRSGAEGANRAHLRATLRFGEALAGRAVAEAERVEASDNAATRVRLAAALPFRIHKQPLSVIGDIDLLLLDERIRDFGAGFTASGFVELPLRSNLRVLAGGSGSTGPFMQRDGSFLARLTWEFDTATVDAEGVQVRRGRLQ
jgi:hypothetical protein